MLAPKLQSGGAAAFEKPIESPDPIAGVGSVLEGFLNTFGSKTNVKGPSEGDIERDGLAFLEGELRNANAIRGQGRGSEANIHEREAMLYAASTYGIDLNSGKVKSMYETATSRPYSYAGKDEGQVILNETLESPEYKSAVMASYATNPEWTNEQRQQYAFTSVQTQAAAKQVIQQSQTQWTLESEGAYKSLLDTYMASNLGVLAATENLSPEDIQMGYQQWQVMKSETLSRPSHVSEEQWKPVADRINQIETAWETRKLFDKDLNEANKQKTISMLNDVIFKADPTIGGRIAAMVTTDAPSMANMMSQDPNRWGGMMGTIQTALDTPITSADATPSNFREGTAQLDTAMKSVEKLGTKGKTDMFAAGMEVASNPNTLAEALTSPKAKDTFLEMSMKGMAALKTLGTSEKPEWLSVGSLKKSFNSNFMANLTTLKASDPETYNVLTAASLDALSTQRVQLNSIITSATQRGDYLTYNSQTGELLPNPNHSNYNTIKGAVDRYYNGDISLALKDNGAKILASASRLSQGVDAYGNTTTLPMNAEQQADLEAYSELQTIRNDPAIANIGSMIESLNFIKSTETQIKGTMKESGGIINMSSKGGTPSGEVATAESSPTIGNAPTVDLSSGNSYTARAMDKYEGGGDYNTLFGHAQRGGPFDGVKVSNMTIAQVLDFTSPSGPYAQHVKSKVGRVATPVGRFQFVGSTIREVARDLGLDINTVKFDEQTQNLFFNHYAKKVLGNKDGASARSAIRSAWEGFKKVPDNELDVVINEIRAGKANFGGGRESGINYDGTLGISGTPMDQLMPPAPMPQDVEADLGGSEGGTGSSGGMTTQEVQQGSVETPEAPAGAQSETGSSRVASNEDARLSKRSQEVLSKLGVDASSVPSFSNLREVMQAIQSGSIQEGQPVMVDGEVMVL